MERVSSGLRLKQIMDERNLKQVDILRMSEPMQKKLGIKMSKSALSQYVNGVQSPDQDRIYLLSKTLDINEAWLMGYDVEKHRIPDNLRKIQIDKTEVYQIPILGIIACGEPITAEENINEYREVLKDNLPSGNLFYLEAKGDSMSPKIPDGSYVLVREQSDVENGEIAAVLLNGDEEATLKKVRKLGKTVLLEALNDAYEPYVINEDNPARIIGKAVKLEVDL